MKIWKYQKLTSTFDKAWEQLSDGKLKEWDSVLALEQEAGRGQLRKSWISLPGNLFVSWRLPAEAPFTELSSAVACGALCVEALRNLSYPVLLKWPNDLMLFHNGQMRKIGGILVEERRSAQVAGLGLNLLCSPKAADLAIPAAAVPGNLAEISGERFDAVRFWEKLSSILFEIWTQTSFKDEWPIIANRHLAYKNEPVSVESEGLDHRGILQGIAPTGACVLWSDGEKALLESGTLRPA